MDRYSKAIESAKKGRGTETPGGEQFIAGISLQDVQELDVSMDQLLKNKVVAGRLDNQVSEYYRILRTRLLRKMSENGWRSIGITGPDPSSGKTLTSVNLSIAISMVPDQSVLLVEGDMRRPAMAKLLGVEPTKGLSDLAHGKCAPNEAIYSMGFDRHALIMNTVQSYGSSDLLISPAVLDLFDSFRQEQQRDFLLVDLPPVFVGDDVLAIANHLDALLVVVEAGRTTRQQLDQTLDALKEFNIAGCVLNRATQEDCAQQHVQYY